MVYFDESFLLTHTSAALPPFGYPFKWRIKLLVKSMCIKKDYGWKEVPTRN